MRNREYNSDDYRGHWSDTYFLALFVSIFAIAVWRCDTGPPKSHRMPSEEAVSEKTGQTIKEKTDAP